MPCGKTQGAVVGLRQCRNKRRQEERPEEKQRGVIRNRRKV